MSEGEEARPFILARKLELERTTALKNYCRAEGATLTDAVLTAYYRCLFRTLGLRARAEVSISVMVDMRRYLGESPEFKSLANLSSMVTTRPG